MKKTKVPKKLLQQIKKRLKTENLPQKGGACHLSSSGSFGNMVGQLFCFIENSIGAAVDGIKATYSVITLPGDLGHDLNRPNEPLPSNTPIRKIIDVV